MVPAQWGNLPYGDPLPSHGAEMAGYFWRVTDVARGRVIVVLCGINRRAEVQTPAMISP